MREIQIVSHVKLTEDQTNLILAVALALNGVRTDLELQDLVDLVTSLHVEGHTWDMIGLACVGAVKPKDGVH